MIKSRGNKENRSPNMSKQHRQGQNHSPEKVVEVEREALNMKRAQTDANRAHTAKIETNLKAKENRLLVLQAQIAQPATGSTFQGSSP